MLLHAGYEDRTSTL